MTCLCGENDACNVCGGVSLLGRLEKDIDAARRITASDPNHVYCRQATIMLDKIWKELFNRRLVKKGFEPCV